MCWVRSRKHSPMPTPERRRFNTLPGHFVSRRQREANESKSPADERNGMTAGLWVQESKTAGREASRWSLGPTNSVISDAGQFRVTQ